MASLLIVILFTFLSLGIEGRPGGGILARIRQMQRPLLSLILPIIGILLLRDPNISPKRIFYDCEIVDVLNGNI